MLDQNQIEETLARLPGWERDGVAITKQFEFDSFMDGIEFVNRVARLAEDMNHHPDMHVGFKKVRIRTWTHKKNATTHADIKLAEKVESVKGG